MKNRFKIGDLVCFNAAGQRRTSLGLVVGIKDSIPVFKRNPLLPPTPGCAVIEKTEQTRMALQILWTICPKMPPQVDWDSYGGWSSNLRKEGNLHREPTWYKNVDSIELAKLS